MTEKEEQQVDAQDADDVKSSPADRRRQFAEHIKRWQKSGLTQTEYCRRNGLKWSTFHYWRKRLGSTTQAVTLVQVPVGFCQESRRPVSGHGLTLLLRDRYKVEIGDDFNSATLIRLVETLERFS
jgi:methylphosphotriester-DNA--protein-cysteine methyltransferase